MVAEAASDGTITNETIWGYQPLARKDGDVWYYYLYNAHGDVICMTDASGNVVNTYAYDAWGSVISESETIANPIRYAGEYYDDELAMYYLRARYYDPSTGRFTSFDAVEGDISDPYSLNRYVYCGNNPVNYVDPSGDITQNEMDMYENGQMAPGAYTFMMLCTYYYYLQDTDWDRAYWSNRAQSFRNSGYTDTGDWYWNWTISEMPNKPDANISQKEHYFRNGINIEYEWDDFLKLQSRLPNDMKWESVDASYHQHNTSGGENIKFVSACGHFEMIFDSNHRLQTIHNNYQDMGTYNYYSPIKNRTLHLYYDWLPYKEYKNVPIGERW